MKNFLTQDERQKLITAHKKSLSYKDADRLKAILLKDEGWSCVAIAHALLIDENTVSRHIKEYKESGKLTIISGGKESKLNAEQTSLLLKHLEGIIYPSVKPIVAYVKEVFGIEYSTHGMVSWLKRNDFSYKHPIMVPAKFSSEKQAEFIAYYNELKLKLPENEPLEFIDATHPNMSSKSSYGWLPKGSRAKLTLKTTANKARLNIYGSINLKSLNFKYILHDKINFDAVKMLFTKLREKYPLAPLIHVFLDQAGYHTSAATKALAKDFLIKLHYLPPYSPNLNPIERCWKVLNEYVRNNKYFPTAKSFFDAIINFLDKTFFEIKETLRSRINDNFQILKGASP